jgi:hypothetical protein
MHCTIRGFHLLGVRSISDSLRNHSLHISEAAPINMRMRTGFLHRSKAAHIKMLPGDANPIHESPPIHAICLGWKWVFLSEAALLAEALLSPKEAVLSLPEAVLAASNASNCAASAASSSASV